MVGFNTDLYALSSFYYQHHHSGSKGKSLAKFVKFAMSFSVAKSGNQSLAKSLLSEVLN